MSNLTSVFEDFTQVRPDNSRAAKSNVIATSGIPFWGDSPASWDTATIAGQSFPGLCVVTGGVKRTLDAKRVAGRNGAKQTHIGDEPAEFTIVIKLWSAAHLRNYQTIIDFLKAQTATGVKASKFSVKPLQVSHPTLTLHGINAAHVVEYGFLEPAGEADVFKAAMKFKEYVPDATAKRGGVVTPNGPVPDTSLTSNGKGAIGKPYDESIRKPSSTNGGLNYTPATFTPGP